MMSARIKRKVQESFVPSEQKTILVPSLSVALRCWISITSTSCSSRQIMPIANYYDSDFEEDETWESMMLCYHFGTAPKVANAYLKKKKDISLAWTLAITQNMFHTLEVLTLKYLCLTCWLKSRNISFFRICSYLMKNSHKPTVVFCFCFSPSAGDCDNITKMVVSVFANSHWTILAEAF